MNLSTLTGKPLCAAFAELDRQLQPEAYKAIQGGKGGALGLTDINPGFLPSVLLELLGPCGLGWGFDLVSLETVEGKTSGGKPEFRSRARLRIWYRYLAGEELCKSDPIEVGGASDNSEIEWAEKGAITNALGSGWSLFGYQVSVYQGLRSHTTAGNGGGPKPPPQRPPQTKQEPQESKTASAPTQTPGPVPKSQGLPAPAESPQDREVVMGAIRAAIEDKGLAEAELHQYVVTHYRGEDRQYVNRIEDVGVRMLAHLRGQVTNGAVTEWLMKRSEQHAA